MAQKKRSSGRARRPAKRKSRTSARVFKTARIGRFDGELKTVSFKAGDTVRDLVSRADLSVDSGEELNDENGNTVLLNDVAKEQDYFLTGNYKNGSGEEEETEELEED